MGTQHELELHHSIRLLKIIEEQKYLALEAFKQYFNLDFTFVVISCVRFDKIYAFPLFLYMCHIDGRIQMNHIIILLEAIRSIDPFFAYEFPYPIFLHLAV